MYQWVAAASIAGRCDAKFCGAFAVVKIGIENSVFYDDGVFGHNTFIVKGKIANRISCD